MQTQGVNDIRYSGDQKRKENPSMGDLLSQIEQWIATNPY
jgi:hypothetical protein